MFCCTQHPQNNVRCLLFNLWHSVTQNDHREHCAAAPHPAHPWTKCSSPSKQEEIPIPTSPHHTPSSQNMRSCPHWSLHTCYSPLSLNHVAMKSSLYWESTACRKERWRYTHSCRALLLASTAVPSTPPASHHSPGNFQAHLMTTNSSLSGHVQICSSCSTRLTELPPTADVCCAIWTQYWSR